MTNPYYNHGSYPAPNSAGASASMRSELDAITAGFNKLPTLTANNVVFVNASGTALEARSGIDNVVIGGTTPAAGTFTTLSATTMTLSSSFILPLGSAAAPSLSFTGDPNNGWWSPGADTQAWSTAGIERVRLNASGALSLAAPSAGHTLTITHTAGSGTGAINTTDGTVVSVIKTVAATSLNINVVTGHALAFGTNDTERMRIDGIGNVGIGTTPSGIRLSVASGTGVWAQFGASNAAASYAQFLRGGTATIGGYIGFDGGALTGTGTGTGFTLRSEADLLLMAGATERMRIDSSGNVGIGTTASGFKLDLGTTGAGSIGGVGNIGGYSDAGAYTIWAGRSSVNGGYVQLYGGSHASPNLVVFGTASTERMRIDASGNVGIGTAPSNTLHINAVSGGSLIRLSDTTPRTLGFLGSGSGIISTASAADFGLRAETNLVFASGGNNERLRIDASGNISTASLLQLSRAGIGIQHSVALSGGVVELDLINTSNTANSQASLFMQVAGAAAGDAFTRLNINGVVDWTYGVDNSDADAFVFAASSSLGSGNILKLGTGSVVDIVGGSGKLNIGGAITRFESAEQSVPTTTFAANAVSHGGPRAPDVSRLVLRCKTAELGYSVGDEVDVTLHNHTMTDRAFNVWHSATQTGYVWITGLNVAPSISHKTTGTMTTVTAASWRVVVYNHWL